jgi:hypothetical protein
MRYVFLIIVSSLAFFSCSDDPSSIGLNNILNEDKFDMKEVSSDTLLQSSSFRKGSEINLGGSSSILLGSYENVKSSILVEFYLSSMADTLLDQILNDSVNVLKAWISSDPIYYIGNKNSAFNYSVHNVRSNWGVDGFNKDSLLSLSFDGEDIATTKYEDSFFVNNAAVMSWLKAAADTSLDDNYGILLQPSGAQKIIGYYTGTSDVYSPFILNIVIQKPDDYQDTLTFATLNDIHIIEGTVPAAQPGYMFVQGGIPIHSEWDIDVSKIPEKAVINSAVLDVFFDSTKSLRGVPPSDSLIVRFDSATTSYDSVQIAILIRDGSKFTGYNIFYSTICK